MLTVLTHNIIEQNHFGNILRTSLIHYLTRVIFSAQSKMIDFASTKAIYSSWFKVNFKRVLKC